MSTKLDDDSRSLSLPMTRAEEIVDRQIAGILHQGLDARESVALAVAGHVELVELGLVLCLAGAERERRRERRHEGEGGGASEVHARRHRGGYVRLE
jgi:hypothetical protein